MKCRSCGSANPIDTTICFICGQPLLQRLRRLRAAIKAAGSTPRRVRDKISRRHVQEAAREERAVIWWLKRLLTAYVVIYGFVTAIAVADSLSGPGDPRAFGFAMQACIVLALMVLAIRRIEDEPVTWALVLASLQTLGLASALILDQHVMWYGVLAVLLWFAVMVCARSARMLAEWRADRSVEHGDAPDLRFTVAVFLMYVGVFGLLYATREGGAFGQYDRFGFYGGLTVIAILAALLAHRPALLEPLRLRPRPSWLGWMTVTLAAAVVYDWWLASLVYFESWTPVPIELGPIASDHLIAGCLLAGIFEEWYCRGVLWEIVASRATPFATLFATSVMFALLHGVGRPGLFGVAPQLVAGILLGLLRLKTGSWVPGVVVHAASNAFVFSAFID